MQRARTTYRRSLDDLVFQDRLGDLVDLVGHVLGGRPTIGYVVLDSKIVVGTARVVARREEDTAIGLVPSDHVGRGGGGQDRVFANDEFLHAVGGTDLEDGLDGLWGKVTTVATDNECCALCVDGIENGLDEVFGVVLQECVSERAKISQTEHVDRVRVVGTP